MIALVVHFFHASQSLSLASRLALLAAAAAEESTLMNFPHFCLVSPLDRLEPSLSMNLLSINNITSKLLSKLLNDFSIGVHSKSSL